MGSLTSGGVIDRVLQARLKSDPVVVVDIIAGAMRDDRPEDLRKFRQPFNPHRHASENHLPMEFRRRKVLQVLNTYPLADVYDLATVEPEYWNCIGRELGGLGHSVVMRHALNYIQQNFAPLEKATFWAAVGNKQPCHDYYKQTGFASNSRRLRGVAARCLDGIEIYTQTC